VSRVAPVVTVVLPDVPGPTLTSVTIRGSEPDDGTVLDREGDVAVVATFKATATRATPAYDG